MIGWTIAAVLYLLGAYSNWQVSSDPELDHLDSTTKWYAILGWPLLELEDLVMGVFSRGGDDE